MSVNLELIDDLLLHHQPAYERVEFAPPLEGQALDKLLTIETGTESPARPAPGLQRDRLPSGPRRNLPGQTIEMPQGLTPRTDCLRQRV